MALGSAIRVTQQLQPSAAKIAPIMLRVLLSAVIIGSSHSFCPAARSACQRHGISAEPADAVGDDALVTTTKHPPAISPQPRPRPPPAATVASTVVTAAGTVCATGACTAAGAAATAAATGTAGAAAGTAGAGLLSQLAYPIAALGLSGALALQSGPEALMDQAAHSALYADAMRSNHPVVLEFYSNDCRHCRHAASSLAETAAAHPGTDWVMVDCQQPESRSLVEKYNVGPIPHFAFLDESKTLRRTEVGESGAKRADAVLRALEGGIVAVTNLIIDTNHHAVPTPPTTIPAKTTTNASNSATDSQNGAEPHPERERVEDEKDRAEAGVRQGQKASLNGFDAMALGTVATTSAWYAASMNRNASVESACSPRIFDIGVAATVTMPCTVKQ